MGLKSQDDLAVKEEGGGKSVPCSICLEAVTENGDRSFAKLQCGHEFHLDCIGSAFNAKGAMQCPNCRKVEKGQWLYANGCRPFPEFGMDEWANDEDLHELSYSEMSFGVHWCPYGQIARLPSSFEEADFPSAAYPDVLGHAVFAEHTAISSAAHPCPYVAYLGPMHQPSTSSSSGSVMDASFSNHWNGPGAEISNFTFPSLDHHHFHSWDHHSLPFLTSSGRHGGPADQASVPPNVPRSSRSNSDMPRSGTAMHPSLVGHSHSHSSGTRSGSSVASTLIPPYPGSNARTRDRVQALQAYYQQQQIPSNGGSAIQSHTVANTRRSNRATLSAEPSSGPYFISNSNSPSTGRSFQDPDNPASSHIHAWEWERDHLPSLTLNQVDRDHPGYAVFHQPAPGGSEPSSRQSRFFRERHNR